MAGMKLITVCIFAKNLPRARDLGSLAASGVTAHSGCEVKIKPLNSEPWTGNGSIRLELWKLVALFSEIFELSLLRCLCSSDSLRRGLECTSMEDRRGLERVGTH